MTAGVSSQSASAFPAVVVRLGPAQGVEVSLYIVLQFFVQETLLVVLVEG